jgi:Holliday junction resolvasome RuvABC DNA-binding subunit
MKINSADENYLEKAKLLNKEDAERLLSRMEGKLPRRLQKDKLTTLEALAIQLEIEDDMLREWREHMAEIRAKG